MQPERLTRRALNRATLQRQRLLARDGGDVAALVQHLVGMQSQAPLAHYVGLWSRLAEFDTTAATAASAALERDELIRTHAMRMTVHLFTRADALSLRGLLQPMLAAKFASTAFMAQLREVDLHDLGRLTRELATETPLSRPDLARHLAAALNPRTQPSRELLDALGYAAVCLEPMLQAPPRGTWGSRGAVRWQTFRGRLGTDAEAPDPGERDRALDELVLRYLAAFGPATAADARTWSGLAGLPQVFARLAPKLQPFVDDAGRTLWDLPDAPRPDPDLPAPVRFLPEYDNLLLSHADRARVIPDRRPVPLPAGDGARMGTVLVDGDFRATWRATLDDDRALLEVTATPALTRTERRDVVAEGLQLLAFLAPDAANPDVRLLR